MFSMSLGVGLCAALYKGLTLLSFGDHTW